MQRQITLSPLSNQFKISMNLDLEDSKFVIATLFSYVESGKISFELKSNPGSIITDISVSVVGGLFSAVLYDFVKKINTYLKEKKKEKEILPVYIFTENRQYILNGQDSDIEN